MSMHRRSLAYLLGVALVTMCCATGQRARVETTLARTLISDEQSNRIGEQVHADVARSGVRYVDDPGVLGYVEKIGERIFTVARAGRPGVDSHSHLIDAPKTVNAFAAPGSPVGVAHASTCCAV